MLEKTLRIALSLAPARVGSLTAALSALVGLAVAPSSAAAADAEAEAGGEPAPAQSAELASSRFASAELNVVWPFVPGVGIYQARGGVKLWRDSSLQGDLLLAVHVRPPTTRETEGDFSEYGGGVAYRQYFWRGLHAEVALYPSYARLDDSVVDGRTYESFALTTEIYAGYRFLLSELGVKDAASWVAEPLATLQGGIGIPTLSSNPWPTTEEEAPLFPVATLLLGVAF
jgi:hypothetical protein